MTVLIALLLFLLPVNLLALDVVQNVARSFIIEAPAVSSTDGVTPQTALTPSTFTVNVYKKNRKAVVYTIATCVYASSILTSSGTAADGETLTFTGTLDGDLLTTVYTFKTTLTGAANEVLIGAAATNTLDNLKSAINDTGTEGTHYGNGTEASRLVNATTKTATQLTVVANIPGSIGNDFTTAETMTSFAWTGSTLASGNSPCMIHDQGGYYWFGVGAGVFDVLGDELITFSYTGVAPFWQRLRVVADASNEANVRGNTATVQGIWDLPKTTASQTASSIGEYLGTLSPLLTTTTIAEPTVPLAANATVADILGWLKVIGYNKLTVTNTTKTYYDDADTALGHQTLSDNGTTAAATKVAP